jgi:hypothetical protein
MAKTLNNNGVVDASDSFEYNHTFTRVNGSLQQVSDDVLKQTGNGENAYIYRSNVDASKYRQDKDPGVTPILNGRTATAIGNTTDSSKMVYNGGARSDGEGPKYNTTGVSDGYKEDDSTLRREKPYTIGDWNANAMRN